MLCQCRLILTGAGLDLGATGMHEPGIQPIMDAGTARKDMPRFAFSHHIRHQDFRKQTECPSHLLTTLYSAQPGVGAIAAS